jgi:type I restriction enzyme, S subunit
MSEWKEYILEDVVEKFIDYRGKTPSKKSFGVPLITAKIIKNGRILEPNEFIAVSDYEGWMTRGFPEINDLVITTEAPLGEVALIKDKNFALAQRIITLQTKKHLCDSVFLKYYFQSNVGQGILQARASGSTVEGIKSAELKKVKISIPTLHEQTGIAEVLSSIDDKIDLLQRQNKTLEQLAETNFRQWFVEEAEESWKNVQLGDFISVKHGYAFKGKYISGEPTNLILITPGNFKIGGGFKSDKFKYYTNYNYPKEYNFQTGDLIVTMTDLSVDGDTLGYSALIPECSKNNVYLHNQRVGKVEFKKNIGKYFIYFLMRTRDYHWYILGGASGTVIRHTSPSAIYLYSFKLPPNEKLMDFENLVEGFELKIRKNQIQIKTLNQLRDILLPKLMSGEVRMKTK